MVEFDRRTKTTTRYLRLKTPGRCYGVELDVNSDTRPKISGILPCLLVETVHVSSQTLSHAGYVTNNPFKRPREVKMFFIVVVVVQTYLLQPFFLLFHLLAILLTFVSFPFGFASYCFSPQRTYFPIFYTRRY